MDNAVEKRKGWVTIFHIHIKCPDWMDGPLMMLVRILSIALIICYIVFVACLAIFYSYWFLFLLLLTPSFKVRKGKSKDEKEKLERFEEWRKENVRSL